MKTTSTNFSRAACARSALVAALALAPLLPGQGSPLLWVAPPPKITAKRNGAAEARLAVHLQSGYHVNSNTPSEDYLIPLRLAWESGPLKPAGIAYPKAEMQKYEFSAKPISVFTGDFQILARFKADANAPLGLGVLLGKLRYQACSHDTCYAPKTVEVRLPYDLQ